MHLIASRSSWITEVPKFSALIHQGWSWLSFVTVKLFIVSIMIERVRMRIESVEFHVSQAFPVNHIMVGFVEAGDQLVRLEVVAAHFAFSRQHLHHQWINTLNNSNLVA